MPLKTHTKWLSIEQAEAIAETERHLLETIVVSTEPVGRASSHEVNGESSKVLYEPCVNEAIIDVAAGMAEEERPAVTNRDMEEPTIPRFDTAVAESKEKLPAANEQQMMVKASPLADVLYTLIGKM